MRLALAAACAWSAGPASVGPLLLSGLIDAAEHVPVQLFRDEGSAEPLDLLVSDLEVGQQAHGMATRVAVMLMLLFTNSVSFTINR